MKKPSFFCKGGIRDALRCMWCYFLVLSIPLKVKRNACGIILVFQPQFLMEMDRVAILRMDVSLMTKMVNKEVQWA